MAASMSRRQFLARGGSVVVGFSVLASLDGVASAAAAALASPAPGQGVDNQWISVTAANPDGTGTLVTVYTGKVELGTGVETALRQVAAEELYVGLDQLAYVQGDTAFDLNSRGYTAGSQTLQVEGVALRRAAAAAFAAVQALALEYFGISSADQLKVADGVFSYRSRRATFGEVIGGRQVTATPSASQPTKSPADYTVVGRSVPRVDLPAKVSGAAVFSADVRPSDAMLYARVIRPSGRNATFAGWGSGYASAARLPGVEEIAQVGNFIYVLATSEATAQLAAATPNVATWTAGPPLIDQSSLPTALTDPANVYAADDQVAVGDAAGALAGAAQQASARYFTPFWMHASAGASAAVADYDGTTLTVWSGTQGPFPLQAAISSLIHAYDGSQVDVHVVYTEQAGCYGHAGADDCSAEAALIAYRHRGPVKLQWTRADEHQWEPLGPAMVHALAGGVTGGEVVSWQHDIYSPTHNARPGGGASAGNLLVFQAIGGLPAPMPSLGPNLATRNGPVDYGFPNMRVGRHFVTSFRRAGDGLAAASPLTWVLPRSTALRSLGGFSNSFANESFVDELAVLAGADPLEFRRRYLSGDTRAADVLDALAHAAKWKSSPPGSKGNGPRPIGPPPASGHATGRGIAFIRYENKLAYVATCVDVDVDLSSGEIAVTDVWVAHDCGLVVNPDGLEHQIEGNVIQGVSRTLLEEVDYTGDRVVQNGWTDFPPYVHGYRVIGFDQVPDISVALVNRPDQPPWGAGEAAVMTLPGAIGNAVFAATGVRIRSLPMTPDVVLAALQAKT